MSQLVEIDKQPIYERRVFFLPLASLESWPHDLCLPTPHFILFLACDANKLTTSAIYEFAHKVIAAGAAYVCTWGAACERVHDIFDEFLVMREIEQGKPLPHIMTTWHNEESLDEALGFALKVALPNATFLASCGLVVVAAVANEEWNAHLPKRLANLTTF